MTRVAVIGGKGRMGSRHCSTLNLMGVDYQCFDIKNGSSIRDVDTDKFTHFIIATLSTSHASDIRTIRKTTDKPILIEKPAITDKKDLDILKDENLFHGVIRRFDEITSFINDWCLNENVYHIDIFKTFPKPTNVADFGGLHLDMNIHHIDAMLQLYPNMQFYREPVLNIVTGTKANNTVTITGQYNTNGNYNDTVVCYSPNKYMVADFKNRLAMFDFRFKTFNIQPLQKELEAFLSGQKCDASEATKACLNLW